MSNSSWAKLVSNNSSADSQDQNPWKKVEVQKKRSLKKSEPAQPTISPVENSESKESSQAVESVESSQAVESKVVGVSSKDPKVPTHARLTSTSTTDSKKVHSPAKIVHTHARSENVDTAVDSKKSTIDPFPLVASWPSLEAASNVENAEKEKSKSFAPQSPVPSVSGDGEILVLEKGKKWSKLPVQIRYNPPNSKNTRNSRDKSSHGKKTSQQFAPQSTVPQGDKPKHFKKNLRQGAADASFNDNASTQSNQSSTTGRPFNNRPFSHGFQNRNTNARKSRDGNLGNSNSFNGNMVQQADQIPYFYTYYQPVIAGGAPPMVPAPFIDPNEQDPSNSLEMVKMWIRGQIEYYYSVENLLRDTYFRKQMNSSHGGVPLSVIAGFNRVKSLLEYAKPYYSYFRNEEDESAEVDPEDLKEWLESVLKSSIESSTYLHLINESDKTFVGIKEGWEYWIVADYPISPTKTASDSYMSAGVSGKVNEETFNGHKVSSLNNSQVEARYNASSLNVPSKDQASTPVCMPSPPVTPSNFRAFSCEPPNGESFALQDTLTDADLENFTLVIPSGSMQVDSHQAEWLNQGLLMLEKKMNGKNPSLPLLDQTPRFWASSSNKESLPLGWYWMSNQSSSSDSNDLEDLPNFDHPSCRFFKDCEFAKTKYSAYCKNVISELENTGNVSGNTKTVLYTFWSCLLQSQFNAAAYHLFREMAFNDARNGNKNGIELLCRIFSKRISTEDNEQVKSDLMKELDEVKQLFSLESNIVHVGH